MALSDGDIKKAMENGDIIIDPFEERCLEPASYDMRMGKEVVKESGRINIEEKGAVILEPGDLVVFGTLEYIKISRRYIGHIGLRSHYTRKGLALLAGPQIDPGYSGILTIAVSNLGPGTITIPYMEKVITIEFFKLITEATREYQGIFKDQRSIPTGDIEYIMSSTGVSISGVVREISALSRSVAELNSTVNNLKSSIEAMKWLIPIIVGIVSGVISIIGYLIR